MHQESMMQDKNFIRGFVVGIVMMLILVAVFYIGTRYGSGAGTIADTQANTTPPTNTQPTPPSDPEGDITKIAKVSKDDHVRGDANAPITMIEYSDFECPYSQRFHETITQLMTEYQGKIRLVYRQFPLRSIHPSAQKASEASECASEQGKFWEMHDKLFDLNKAKTFNLDTIKKAAVDLKLDSNKFDLCLDSGKYVKAVEQDYQDGIKGGITGTPGTFVNDTFLAGALPYDQIKQLIDSLL